MKEAKEASGQEDDEGEEYDEKGNKIKAGEVKLIANTFILSQEIHHRSSPRR